ncbi:MAG: hypothetical protein FJX60_15470 [Alphaproteobacteria bacterium]|nr:hypothetical protein [Alphaproteobacteria bacterium]
MVEFVKPPRALVDKTGRGTPGAGDRLIKKADEAVKQHQGRVDYRVIAGASLDKLNELMRQFATDPASHQAIAKKIYELCHDLKGEGASFGYPAVSRCADLICRVIDCEAQRDKRFLEIVKVEVESIRAMIRYDVKGNPRGVALEIIDALEFLVDNFLDKMKAAEAA